MEIVPFFILFSMNKNHSMVIVTITPIIVNALILDTPAVTKFLPF